MFTFTRNNFAKHRANIRGSLRNVTRKRFAVSKKKKGLDIETLRNIGISAHIDSGKTTLTERILFYSGRIGQIHEVRGKDGVGAKMDSMDLEREKGITIKSAATYVNWKDHTINVIDTPGHVDFTIEVERALFVLDGAILVCCSVAGVQSQTMTVDKQMKRYGVPRIVFINKLDRLGADPNRAINALRDKIGLNAVAMQIPIGLSGAHKGVVDLIKMKALNFAGASGEEVREEDIPAQLVPIAKEKRQELIDAVLEHDLELMEEMMEAGVEEPTIEQLEASIRKCVIANKIAPVFMGSAFKNKGVQPVLDAVVKYLPSPNQREVSGYVTKRGEEEEVKLSPNPKDKLVALAFKLEESKFGQLTWIRVYQGKLKKGQQIFNTHIGDKAKPNRLVKMNSAELEDINEVSAGDICAIFGVDCASGETFTDDKAFPIKLSSMHVPDPVISLGITTKDASATHLLAKALDRFSREDPTFSVGTDDDTGETVISGMGELHLQIYIERMKREYGLAADVSEPRVAFRETIQSRSDFDYLHKKQSGGQGQYAKVIGYMEPIDMEDEEDIATLKEGENNEFRNDLVGQNVPPNFVPAIEKGFYDSVAEGPLMKHPVERVRFVITDGAYHPVDSSEFAFRTATKAAFREAFEDAQPTLIEPIMNVEIRGPAENQQNINTTISKRGGIISNSTIDATNNVTIDCTIPLAKMFGYANQLRSATEGKGEFSMEYYKHEPVNRADMDSIIAKYGKK